MRVTLTPRCATAQWLQNSFRISRVRACRLQGRLRVRKRRHRSPYGAAVAPPTGRREIAVELLGAEEVVDQTATDPGLFGDCGLAEAWVKEVAQ